MGTAGAAALDLPVGTELTYSGSVIPQIKQGGTPAEDKTFTLTALALPDTEGNNQLAWSLEERGAGGWAWPERFGLISLQEGSKPTIPSLRLLHTHDGNLHPIGVRSPLFEFQGKLAADATWTDSRVEYRVARKRKVKDRDGWQVEATTNLGRYQTILVDATSGLILSLEQRVFMGRGDEFQLKMELQSQRTLSAEELHRSQIVLASLRELQTTLQRTGEQKQADLTAPQLKTAQDAIAKIESQAEGTIWSKLTVFIKRDLVQQQRRIEGAAGLATKFLGQPAPKVTLKRADGTPIPASELQGKVTVLHFWEYRGENLMEPYGQVGYLDFLNGKRKKLGVKVVGVNVDSRFAERDNAAAALRSMKKLQEFMNLGYDVAVDDGTLVTQFGDPRALGSALPLWVVIGHDGKVSHYQIGYYLITPDEGLKQLDEAVITALRKQRDDK
jgi:peroxiredoxin